MKKNFVFLGLVLLGFVAIVMPSCDKSDEETNDIANGTQTVPNELQDKYFTVENATYVAGELPASTGDVGIEGITYNEKALQGGMNFFSINSKEELSKVYLGMEGIAGYYEIDVVQSNRSQTRAEEHYYTYLINVSYAIEFQENITMLICVKTVDGKISQTHEAPVEYVTSLSGDLNINLVFNNEKDVDLHLYTPDGTHIYYGNRGGTYTNSNNEEVYFGLDHDSNPGCSIDGLNNENIVIPEELIQNGTYSVRVDMFSNCNSSIATLWSLVVRYKGNLVLNELEGKSNPVSGEYPIGAGNDDMTEVMRFTINNGTRAAAMSEMPNITPFKLTDAELLKIQANK